MAYTPNTNQNFQPGEQGSIFGHKESYRKFLEELAQLDLTNSIADSKMSLWDEYDLPIYWSTNGAAFDFNDITSGLYTNCRKITFSSAPSASFSQTITGDIKADSVYTAILNIYNPGVSAQNIVFSVEASGNIETMFKDLNSTTSSIDLVSATIAPDARKAGKGVVQFKTVKDMPASGSIVVKVSYTDNASGSNIVYLDSVCLYKGAIELAYTPDPIIKTGPRGFSGSQGQMGIGTDTFDQEVWIVDNTVNTVGEVTYSFNDILYITGGVETGRHLQIFQNGQRLVPKLTSSGVSGEYEEIETFTGSGLGNSVRFRPGVLNFQDTIVIMMGGIGGSTSMIPGTSVPIGMINWFANVSAPPDWLECNGQIVAKADYATLYSVIMDTYLTGVVSADHFQVPDLRGKFIRGYAASGAIDANRTFASTQLDDLKSHTHDFTASVTAHAGDALNSSVAYPNLGDIPSSGTTQYNATSSGSPGTETRPINVALLPCIKAKGNVEQITFSTGNPIGSIITLPSTAIPAGYLECNGQSIATTDYPALFEQIQYTYGGNSSTFNVPNYQGMFLRGWSHGISGANYPSESGRILGNNGVQLSEFKSHAHIENYSHADYDQGNQPAYPTPNVAHITASNTSNYASSPSSDLTAASGGAETRPVNMAVVYAIKAVETDINYLSYATSATISETVPVSGIITDSNKANNGYITMPDGFIMQWGVTAIPANNTVVVTFPIAFNTAIASVTANPKGGVIEAASISVDWTSNKTQMSITNNHPSTSFSVSWNALGY